MSAASVFSKLGLFVMSGFLDDETCADLRKEVQAAALIESKVEDSSTLTRKVKSTVRRTKAAKASETNVSMIHSRLTALCPQLEEHFGVRLKGCERPQFLVYEPGDFFLPHTDGDSSPNKPQYVRDRKLSVTLFLNSEAPAPTPDSLVGGSLVFYGLVKKPNCEAIGFPLKAETGLIVAFPADVVHEVRPIVQGKRYSIVSWFF